MSETHAQPSKALQGPVPTFHTVPDVGRSLAALQLSVPRHVIGHKLIIAGGGQSRHKQPTACERKCSTAEPTPHSTPRCGPHTSAPAPAAELGAESPPMRTKENKDGAGREPPLGAGWSRQEAPHGATGWSVRGSPPGLLHATHWGGRAATCPAPSQSLPAVLRGRHHPRSLWGSLQGALPWLERGRCFKETRNKSFRFRSSLWSQDSQDQNKGFHPLPPGSGILSNSGGVPGVQRPSPRLRGAVTRRLWGGQGQQLEAQFILFVLQQGSRLSGICQAAAPLPETGPPLPDKAPPPDRAPPRDRAPPPRQGPSPSGSHSPLRPPSQPDLTQWLGPGQPRVFLKATF